MKTVSIEGKVVSITSDDFDILVEAENDFISGKDKDSYIVIKNRMLDKYTVKNIVCKEFK